MRSETEEGEKERSISLRGKLRRALKRGRTNSNRKGGNQSEESPRSFRKEKGAATETNKDRPNTRTGGGSNEKAYLAKGGKKEL